MGTKDLPGYGDPETWGGREPYSANEDAMSALDAQCYQAARDDSDSSTLIEALWATGEVELSADFDRIINKMIAGEVISVFEADELVKCFEAAVHQMLCKKSERLADEAIERRARGFLD